MAELQRLFGETPRVKALEAILRLRGLDFSRPEFGLEAAIHKPSAYRVAREFAEEGIIRRRQDGRFEVVEDCWEVPMLYRVMDAIGHEERKEIGRPSRAGPSHEGLSSNEVHVSSTSPSTRFFDESTTSTVTGQSQPLVVGRV